MDIETCRKIFEILSIDMIYIDDIIKEKTDDREAYYVLKPENNKWNIVFCQRGKMQVKYSFEDKNNAIKYFVILMIKEDIIKNIVIPMIISNPILYDVNVSFEDIMEIFSKNNIYIKELDTYSLELVEYDQQYILNIIDKGKIIYKSNEMNKTDAICLFFQWGCILYKYISIINMFMKIGIKTDLLKNEEIIVLFKMN